MSGNSEPRKYKNPVLNWIEFRLPIISYFQKEYGEYPMPKNCNYFWSFGWLLHSKQYLRHHPHDQDLIIFATKQI